MNFERIEYFCPGCHEKGTIDEVLLHPTVVLLRGRCSPCGIGGAIRAIDLLQLAEHIDETVPLPKKPVWRKLAYHMTIIE